MISTKLRKTLNAKTTAGVLDKLKNQTESIETLIAEVKARGAANTALQEALNQCKADQRRAEQQVVDLTAANEAQAVELNNLRQQNEDLKKSVQ